jgi:predicted RNA-binding protein with PUA-like domain
MNYWLLKSEPGSYSIDDLQRQTKTPWDGVRNYQARNFMMKEMKVGDLAFFYHSNCKQIGIVGVCEVSSESYPDFTAFDQHDHHYDPKSSPEKPRWFMVDIKFRKKFKRVISLEELKQTPALDGMMILRKGNRLSITPIQEEHWKVVEEMV